MDIFLYSDPATFQALINWILHDGIDTFMVVYMVDILVFRECERTTCHM